MDSGMDLPKPKSERLHDRRKVPPADRNMELFDDHYCCTEFFRTILNQIRNGKMHVQPEIKHFLEAVVSEGVHKNGLQHWTNERKKNISLMISVERSKGKKKVRYGFILIERAGEFYGLLEDDREKLDMRTKYMQCGGKGVFYCEKCKVEIEVTVWKKGAHGQKTKGNDKDHKLRN